MANPSASPSLVWVHSAAGLSRRFRSWFDKACVNYGELVELKGVVGNVLRRERREELTGEEKTKFTDALLEYEKIVDGLAKFITLKSYVDFVGITDEDLIKWVGDEIVSLGYGGFRERSSQYWLWDLRAEKLPFEKKVRQVFDFYGVFYRMRIPSQEQSETMLLEFLENVKRWPRSQLVWVVKNVYPLSDLTGGFWTAVRKVVELEALWDAWEDIMDRWRSEIISELKKMAQFQVLKTILMAEWEAEKYLQREIFETVKNELMVKYGETTQDPAWVRAAFRERAVELFAQRTPVESKIIEVYEEIKPLVPAEKVELTRAGLWKAIRWAFLHPTVDLDSFASSWVFPLGFTTEEARAIASKILEKVVKPPVVAPPPIVPPAPPVAPVLTDEEKTMLNIFFLDKLKGAGIVEPEKYKPEFEKALDITKNYAYNLAVTRDVADDIIERVRPIPKVIEVHVKVKVSEGEDPGTYVAMLMFDTFEVTFVGLTSTPALKTFLESGEEWVDFTEQYRMAGFEEEEMRTHLAELPYPFSTGMRIRVYWKYPEDVEFTPKARDWWNIYYMTYFRHELEALTVPVLTEIAKIKQVRVGRTKEELISSILGLPPPPTLPPALAPPVAPPPPEKRPLWELPEQIKQLTEDLEKEAYATFIAAGLPYEEWLKHRATISLQIKTAVDMFGGAKKLEAEKKVRESVAKFVSDLIEKVKKPPPEVVFPPAVVPAVFPPAVEIVYAPREKPLSEEELKALQAEILGMPYEKAVDEYLKAITEGRTADVDAWKKKFAESSELVKMKRKIVK